MYLMTDILIFDYMISKMQLHFDIHGAFFFRNIISDTNRRICNQNISEQTFGFSWFNLNLTCIITKPIDVTNYANSRHLIKYDPVN